VKYHVSGTAQGRPRALRGRVSGLYGQASHRGVRKMSGGNTSGQSEV
jgi:hypothetical protein